MRGVWWTRGKGRPRAAGCLLGTWTEKRRCTGSLPSWVSSRSPVSRAHPGRRLRLPDERWAGRRQRCRMTCDRRRTTRAGKRRREPGLFWGCGRGGNFGVVTGIDYKLYPVVRRSSAALLPGLRASAQVSSCTGRSPSPPAESRSSRSCPAPLPVAPKEMHGSRSWRCWPATAKPRTARSRCPHQAFATHR